MKSGVRILGIAESYQTEMSTLCGAVTTTGGILDGCEFTECTVGGTDVTDSILSLWSAIDRPDIQAVLLSGVALAWYNIVELHRVNSSIPVPVIAITYEESEGLREAIETEFDETDALVRLQAYETLPQRREISVNGKSLYVRSPGDVKDIVEIIRAVTPAGGRPEPVRVARILARAADQYHHAARAKPES